MTLPRGVVDLASDIPVQDVKLIATTATLLARPGVHPALLQLFSQTALNLHGQAGKVTVPLSYADELYALRNHIDLVRQKLTQP